MKLAVKLCGECAWCVSQAAEQNDCAIFVHPWDMQMSGRMQKYFLPWLVGKFLELDSCTENKELLQRKFAAVCARYNTASIPFYYGAKNVERLTINAQLRYINLATCPWYLGP